MASELSELRAELWRTRDDLERMKTRTPPSVERSRRRVSDDRMKRESLELGPLSREDRPHKTGERRAKASIIGSGRTSLPTSAESSDSDRKSQAMRASALKGSRSGGRSFSDEAAAEETLSTLELEGAAFKNWTEEASSIAVRLIEEVKTLRWERSSWAEREASANRAASDLRQRMETLESTLVASAEEGRRTQEALLRAQQAERDQRQATARVKAELRTAQEKIGELKARRDGGAFGAGGLREQLRREKEGADALQRRLDEARTIAMKHERERKEWRASRAKLDELRRSWGKQLRKVEKKMRYMAKEKKAMMEKIADADRGRERAESEARVARNDLQRLIEQRDNLLLGATRTGSVAATSPADALTELLAAAAAGVVAGVADDGRAPTHEAGRNGAERGRDWVPVSRGGRARHKADDLEAELEQARVEAKLARVAAQQERLRREGAAREKEEAVRQLHKLMGAARRAVGRRDARIRSSKLETEVVWNALTEAVR